MTVRGVQGHVAYPHKAKNPLPGLLDALNLLRARSLDAGNEHFQRSNFEITSIDTGNKTSNLIPASVTARFNIRFNDQHTSQSLKAWIENGDQLMPPFKDVLEAGQIKDVITYVKTL